MVNACFQLFIHLLIGWNKNRSLAEYVNLINVIIVDVRGRRRLLIIIGEEQICVHMLITTSRAISRKDLSQGSAGIQNVCLQKAEVDSAAFS